MCSECVNDYLIAIDASIENRRFWGDMVKQTKTILRSIEHLKEVEFGIGGKKSKLAVQAFPIADDVPSLSFENYGIGSIENLHTIKI